MSHIAKVQIIVKDLEALAAAATALGCELVTGQKTHRYYANAQGKCEHAIRVTGSKEAYEIGVVRGADGNWELQADFYQGGRGLAEKVGADAVKLRQEYAAQVAEKQARRMGKRVQRSLREDGAIVLRAY